MYNISEDHELAQTILDSISAHVAILDKDGFILKTNRAWKRFARLNEIQIRPDTFQVNYLEICNKASSEDDGNFAFVAEGIREVMLGKKEEFVMDYPCHSPDEKRWFNMRVTRTAEHSPARIIISHEDITSLKLAEEHARQSERELLHEKHRLEELNTALKVLLKHREKDQAKLEGDVLDNINQLLLPLVSELQNQKNSEQTRILLSTLETRLENVTKPFIQRVAGIESILTPQEIKIATMIREGHNSKEISQQLNLSLTTINFHRRNLRSKFKLCNTGTNLYSFLTSLSQ